MAGIIAYLRNMNVVRHRDGEDRRCRPRPRHLRRQGRLHRGVTASAPADRASAPNLSDIGAARSAGSLQRSLLDPTSQMMPINRPVRVVTKDGTVINGRRLNEDTYSAANHRRPRASASRW